MQKIPQLPQILIQLAAFAAFDKMNFQPIGFINILFLFEAVAVEGHVVVAADFQKKVVLGKEEVGTELPSPQKHQWLVSELDAVVMKIISAFFFEL